jgi:hypothetical protein
MAAFMLVPIRRERQFRYTSHLHEMTDSEMIRRYRFSNEGVNYIVNLLENDLKRSTKRNLAILPRNQVLHLVPCMKSLAIPVDLVKVLCQERLTVSQMH